MRLAVCTLSAVLLSGCSWFGSGGNSGSFSNYNNGVSCSNAGNYGGQYGYGNQYGQGHNTGGGYGTVVCGGAKTYATNGYAAQPGYAAQGTQAVMNLRGAQGLHGYNAQAGYQAAGYPGGYGAQLSNGQWGAGSSAVGTVLGSSAPYGNAVGGQYANLNNQWSTGTTANIAGGYGYNASGNVRTVQGSPIYVPQPYPAYYGGGVASGGCASNMSYVCGGGLRGGSAALPFGIEAGIGTEIAIGGDIIGAKPAGPALGGAPGATLNVSALNAISYGDAYNTAVSYDLGASYDINPSTTIISRLGYSNAKGERLRIGTIDDSAFVPAPAVVTTEDLYARWSDLEQFTLEGGVRKYMGGWNNAMGGLRPYAQATAGFTHNNAVSLSQDSATLMPIGSNVQTYADAGWTPTASGAIGAEMQLGPRTALGVEAGVRWRDDLNAIFESEDRWSVPIKLRGRISF